MIHMLFMFDRTLNKPEVPAPVLSNSSLLLISYLHANLALLLIQGYTKILRISPYSVRMRENTDKKNSEYGHFLRSVTLIIFDESFKTTVNINNMFY